MRRIPQQQKQEQLPKPKPRAETRLAMPVIVDGGATDSARAAALIARFNQNNRNDSSSNTYTTASKPFIQDSNPPTTFRSSPPPIPPKPSIVGFAPTNSYSKPNIKIDNETIESLNNNNLNKKSSQNSLFVPPRPASRPISSPDIDSRVTQNNQSKPPFPQRPVIPPRPTTVRPKSSSDADFSDISPQIPAKPAFSGSLKPPVPFRPPLTLPSRPSSFVSTAATLSDDEFYSDYANWHPAMIKMKNYRESQQRSRRRISNYLSLPDEHRFAPVDSYAIACPEHLTLNLETLREYLVFPFEDDLDIVRAVFCWVANNIIYDVAGFLSRNLSSQSPEDVIKSRTSVCEGYAALFHALLPPHIKSWKMHGAARGVTMNPGDAHTKLQAHAWNAVEINGETRFIECTWAAGGVSGTEFTKFYQPVHFFCIPPENFLFMHWSEPDVLGIDEWISIVNMGPMAAANDRFRVLRDNGVRGRELLSLVEIWDDYLEITVEGDDYENVEHGGDTLVVAGKILGGALKPVQEGNESKLGWIRDPPYRNTCQAVDFQSNMLPHVQRSTRVAGKMEFTIRGYCPPGDSICQIMSMKRPDKNQTVHQTFKLDLIASFRVMNHGSGSHSAPPKSYFHDLNPLEPLEGTLRVGERIQFKAEGNVKQAAIVDPHKKLKNMHRDHNGVWVLDLYIDTRGEWCLASGDSYSYSFSAIYNAI
ncbi:hypothetical protein HK100_000437 [Physocladia obscura]|uniref:Transglutaminase-like domain-containing protein n=1 Tax=Physocladia obscura TaxID=109957 RepID=A0AAD5SZV9_9FUNG|nr:hypothetical protein HK100_000437 [Physocladia obscura]